MVAKDFYTIKDLQQALLEHAYVADQALATAVFLTLRLQKPLLLEGEAGVGKTQIAKTLAEMLDRPLIRLQCYEGLDVNSTIYEWNYARQLLHIRALEAQDGRCSSDIEQDLFSERYLIKRPLLQAFELSESGTAPVLLIDEIDRADVEFEAFLLELLSDYQITIPEIGTIRAKEPPIVIITSNRTREIHDALKRRCIYHWIDYPTAEKEYQIVMLKVPEATSHLAQQLVLLVQELRHMDLYKVPGVAETLDWAEALVTLDAHELDETIVNDTLGVLLKYQDDIETVRNGPIQKIIARLRARIQSDGQEPDYKKMAPPHPCLPEYNPEAGYEAPVCGG